MKRVIVFIILFLLITSFLVFLFLRFVVIQNIYCSNQTGSCSQKLRSEISDIHKSNIFEMRRQLEEVLKNNKRVSEYFIEFSLPLNFQVNVIEDTGVVAFVKPDNSFAIINKQGEIVENVQETNLPKVTSYRSLTTDQLMYIANLMERIYNFSGSTSSKVIADGVEIDNIQGKKVIFPLVGDQDVLIGSLTLILSRLPSVKEGTTIKVIDLRYKNPVLRS